MSGLTYIPALYYVIFDSRVREWQIQKQLPKDKTGYLGPYEYDLATGIAAELSSQVNFHPRPVQPDHFLVSQAATDKPTHWVIIEGEKNVLNRHSSFGPFSLDEADRILEHLQQAP